MDHLCYLCFVFVSWSTPELRLRLARVETGLSPPVKYFTDASKAVLFLWIIYNISVCFLARLFIDALWSPAVRGRTSSDVRFWSCDFSIGTLCHVCCSIVSIPDLCSLSYFYYLCWYIIIKTKDMHTSIRSRQQLFCLFCTCNRIKISKDLFSWYIVFSSQRKLLR